MKYSSAIIERLLALGLTEQEINTATEQEIKIRLSDAFNETQNSSARIELEEEDLSDILDILEMNEITVSQSETTTSSNEDLFAEVEEEATAVVIEKKGKKATKATVQTPKATKAKATAAKAEKAPKVTKAKAEKSEEDLLSEIRATTTKTVKEQIQPSQSPFQEFAVMAEEVFKALFGGVEFEVRFKKNGFAFFVSGKCVISFHTISINKFAMTFKTFNKKKELFDEMLESVVLPAGVKVFFSEGQYNGLSNIEKDLLIFNEETNPIGVAIFEGLIKKSLEFCSKSTAQKAKNLQKINEILKSDSNTVQEEAEEVIEIQEEVLVLDNEISDVEAVSDLQFIEEIDVQVTDSVNESEEPIEVVIPVIKSKRAKK